MRQTLHIIRKDLRRLRWWLGAWLALLAARVLLVMAEWRTVTDDFAEQFALGQANAIVAALILLMLALLIARLVHEEPLVGLDWFWFTRPYDRRALLGAKLLIASFFFVVVPFVTELVLMASAEAGARDMMRAGSVVLARDIARMLGLMVMAVLTPSLVMFALGLVGSAAASVVALVTLMAVALLTFDEETPSATSAVGDPTPGLVATAVFVVASLAVIIYQYRRRRPARAIALAAAGAVALVIVPAVWPWSFARPPAPDPGAWARDPAQVAAVVDRSVPPEISGEPVFSRRRSPKRQVSVPVSLTGLPPEYRVQNVFAQARLEFPDGHAIQSAQSGVSTAFRLSSSSNGSTNALQGALGDVRLASFDEPVHMAALLTITEDELERYRAQAGRLTATLHYALQRSRMIGRLPLEEGAALDANSMRIEIVRVDRRRDGCAVVVRQWNASSLWSPPEYRQYDFVLRNAERRQAFMGDRREWLSSETFGAGSIFLAGFLSLEGARQGFALRRVGFDYPLRLRGRPTQPSIDPGWLDGADLAVVETAPAGQIMRTVTIEDFLVE